MEMFPSKLLKLLPEIEWCSDCLSLISILSNVEYPCFLRFTEKQYSDEHMKIEQNDVLFLEDCLIRYVLKARLSTCDSRCSYVERLANEEDIFLPLECKQPGVIKPLMVDFDKVIFHCPRDLGVNFPRFVRTMNEVKCVGGQDEQRSMFVIPKNEIIEILRWEYKSGVESPEGENNKELNDSSKKLLSEKTFEIYNWTKASEFSSFEEMRLICSWNNKLLALSSNAQIELQGVQDQSRYIIQEILEMFPLPQAILFTKELDSDQVHNTEYSGCYLLKELCPVFILNGYHVSWKNRTHTEKFRLPLVMVDAHSLNFSIGRVTRESLASEELRNESKHLILRAMSISETSCRREETQHRRRTFTTISDLTQNQQIPFELTYTQYRFPTTANKPNQGDKIFKKVQSAVQSVKGIFKKASSQDVAAIRNNVLKVNTPEPIRKASTKLYPILANLMNEDSSLYDYIESGTLGKKRGESQSQFYFEIEAPTTASAPSEECLSGEMSEEENIYQNLDQFSIQRENDGKSAEAGDPRNERTENKTKTRAEVGSESVTEAEACVADNGNEAEKDSDSFADGESVYMNYNEIATLQIRRHLPLEKRGSSCASESTSSEEVSQDSNSNAVAPDEKSDFSTEEEEDSTESSSSVNINLANYDFVVRDTIPDEARPVPAKRNLNHSSEAVRANGVSSDACDNIKTTVSNSNGKQSTQLEDMSVQELCEILEQCGLSHMSTMCKQHSLDGAFLCALPDDSLQDPPFSLSHLEIMKVSMMKKGWKPKMK